jgi:hypothetical protein
MHDGRPGTPCPSCGSTRGLWPVLAQKTALAYVVVRAVRLLQARGALPGHSGAEVCGVHVHHLVYGGILVVAQQAAASRSTTCLHQPTRANVLCTGAALMLDEFDIITRTEGRREARVGRPVLDALALVLLASALKHPKRTLRG